MTYRHSADGDARHLPDTGRRIRSVLRRESLVGARTGRAWSACAAVVAAGRLPRIDRIHGHEAQVRDDTALGECVDGAAFGLVPPQFGRRAEQHADDTVVARVASHPAPITVDDQLVIGSRTLGSRLHGPWMLDRWSLGPWMLGSYVLGTYRAGTHRPGTCRVRTCRVRSRRPGDRVPGTCAPAVAGPVACAFVPSSLHAAHGRARHRQERAPTPHAPATDVSRWPLPARSRPGERDGREVTVAGTQVRPSRVSSTSDGTACAPLRRTAVTIS